MKIKEHLTLLLFLPATEKKKRFGVIDFFVLFFTQNPALCKIIGVR